MILFRKIKLSHLMSISVVFSLLTWSLYFDRRENFGMLAYFFGVVSVNQNVVHVSDESALVIHCLVQQLQYHVDINLEQPGRRPDALEQDVVIGEYGFMDRVCVLILRVQVYPSENIVRVRGYFIFDMRKQYAQIDGLESLRDIDFIEISVSTREVSDVKHGFDVCTGECVYIRI